MEYKLLSNDCARAGGFPYLINTDGHLWSINNERFVNPSPNHNGYLHFVLCNKGKRQGVRIHRLVAEAFIPNPENKPCINHIDRDKTNNHVSNLEWCTHRENTDHWRHDENIRTPRKAIPSQEFTNAPS